ncbi:protease modulator HflC [Salinisphaera sp. USBA-960]|uniref:protease modulator HflC n=1 Tax=Salinisphaera orenii TaxID=856731 RepID=UPI000DBE1C8C|nr:protease modulator HflC [Salifodinibacter halophilus]NNC26057.1 protease modulator HflC [Salifodinibacter halophilus]
MTGKQIAGLVIAVIAVVVAYNSYFVVTPRERIVLVQMGDIVGSNYPPGLHFKVPFIQQEHNFDRRIRALTGNIDRVLTAESKNLAVKYYVKWRINDTVDYYLSTHGSAQRAQGLLSDLVKNDLLAAFSKRTIEQAVGNQRDQILAAVAVQVNKDAKQYGMHVADVRIMKLNLPEQVSKSVYKRMRSKREEVIKALRAEGDAAGKEIRSDARRARTEILAKAYRKAEKLKGAGDAKAARIYAKAYKQNPEFYTFYRSLQLYRNNIGSGDLLLLKPNGKLFQFFNPLSRDSEMGKSSNAAKSKSNSS